jgi:hypothetical protein
LQKLRLKRKSSSCRKSALVLHLVHAGRGNLLPLHVPKRHVEKVTARIDPFFGRFFKSKRDVNPRPWGRGSSSFLGKNPAELCSVNRPSSAKLEERGTRADGCIRWVPSWWGSTLFVSRRDLRTCGCPTLRVNRRRNGQHVGVVVVGLICQCKSRVGVPPWAPSSSLKRRIPCKSRAKLPGLRLREQSICRPIAPRKRSLEREC